MRLRPKPATTTATTTDHKCYVCGGPVPRRPFEPDTTDPKWIAHCDTCNSAGITAQHAAALAAAGIETDPTDPAVIAAMSSYPWMAHAHAHTTYLAAQPTIRNPIERAARERAAERNPYTGPPVPATRQPWAHLDENPKALRTAIEQARERLDRRDRPRRHRGGPCGACGQRKAPWWRAPVQFGNSRPGAPATKWPICADCATRLPKVSTSEPRWTRALLAAYLDLPHVPMALDSALLPYAATVEPGTDPQRADGCAARWGYVSEEARAEVWRRNPAHRPADVRDREARALRAAARIAAAAAPRRPSAIAPQETP